MPALTKVEAEKFLAGPNIAKVATVKDDGSPFVVPVWYDWDGKYCYIVGRKRSSWVRYIQRDPRVTILIDSSDPPYPKVTIEGKAEIIGDTIDDWVKIGKRMVVKYFGPDAGISYLKGSLDQPRKTIRVKPKTFTSWITPDEKTIKKNPRLSWASRYYEPGSKWYKDLQKEKQTVRKRRK